jgi:hypothetical protein
MATNGILLCKTRSLCCLGSIFACLLSTALSAHALSINLGGAIPNDPGPPVGGLTITDNGAGDVNPAAGTLNFNTVVQPQGYVVSGRVTIAGGGALVGVANITTILNLTDFAVTRPAGAAGGQFNVSFVETFAAPPAPVDAADNIRGTFTNPGGTVGTGTVGFRGSVNDMRIGGTFFMAFAGQPSPQDFEQGPHVITNIGGGPPWTLRGEVQAIVLGPGDTLSLPNSAEVGIGPTAVPEPSTLLLWGAAMAGLSLAARWKQTISQITESEHRYPAPPDAR